MALYQRVYNIGRLTRGIYIGEVTTCAMILLVGSPQLSAISLVTYAGNEDNIRSPSK